MLKIIWKICILGVLVVNINAEEIVSKKNILLESCIGCEEVEVSLNGLINEIVNRNYELSSEKMQVVISEHQVKLEEGIFEPKINLSSSYSRTNIPNNAEQTLSRGYEDEYKDRVRNAEASIGGLIFTGGEWNLGFSDKKNRSNLIEETQDYDAEYSDRITFSFNQPLLRGMGTKMTHAKINIAKINTDISKTEYKNKLMGLVATTIQLYWKLYGTQKLYLSWSDTLKITKKQLTNLEALANYGKIAQTELLEAKSSVYQKETELLGLKSSMKEIQSRLLSLLNLSNISNSKTIFLAKDAPTRTTVPQITSSFEKAVKNLPELKLAELKVETERLKYLYNENQVLPDLKLNTKVYSLGVESTQNNSLYCSLGCEKHISWSVGLNLEIPLYGNDQAQENLAISKIKLSSAELEIKSLHTIIYNLISTKIEQLQTEQQKVDAYHKEVALKSKLLALERQKMELGRAKMRDILEYEDKLITAQRKLYNSVVNAKVAEALLNKATGDLLQKQNIDVSFNNIVNNTDSSEHKASNLKL
ncbi:MAG: Unknown protein [uncultured Sulfurovum sp.]|uniref:Outer membrane efflux protein n=1 Tax=uncultured Sulfurovum sp. TaxID=269237 RepID=A0A6S6T227_9BACT|nr:MAG: Unknown protein [uncultured Sulfurovum sp.]